MAGKPFVIIEPIFQKLRLSMKTQGLKREMDTSRRGRSPQDTTQRTEFAHLSRMQDGSWWPWFQVTIIYQCPRGVQWFPPFVSFRPVPVSTGICQPVTCNSTSVGWLKGQFCRKTGSYTLDFLKIISTFFPSGWSTKEGGSCNSSMRPLLMSPLCQQFQK